ncbi:MAG: TetR/AcrR family transcriptional regulator [Betaproteobacteria bacterium]|nr:MAG: TetR/AcrR family transcriptional regulator [Betaproteobacteria bacterium]
MRKSREAAAKTRERIVSGASAMFRERGLDNVSVAELMAQAGLTHGGFYAHFGSRDELVAEAVRYALLQSAHRIYLSALKTGETPGYARLIKRYLTTEHRDNPDSGCVLASLGAEIGRDKSDAKAVFSEGFDELVTLLAQLSPERTRNARRAHILSVISSLSGALILARAVNGNHGSEEILASVRTTLLADEKRRQLEHAVA